MSINNGQLLRRLCVRGVKHILFRDKDLGNENLHSFKNFLNYNQSRFLIEVVTNSMILKRFFEILFS